MHLPPFLVLNHIFQSVFCINNSKVQKEHSAEHWNAQHNAFSNIFSGGKRLWTQKGNKALFWQIIRPQYGIFQPWISATDIVMYAEETASVLYICICKYVL